MKSYVMLFCVILSTVGCVSAQHKPFTTSDTIIGTPPAYSAYCTECPDAVICSTNKSVSAITINETVLSDVFYTVKDKFVGKSDKEQFGKSDHWTSHAKEVEQDQKFYDDCDGFVLTVVDMLVKKGVPASSIELVGCKTEKGENHIVCLVDRWVLDNRQKTIKAWDVMKYTWQYSMNVGQPRTWKRV